MFGDPKVQEQFRKLGDDPKKDVAIYAEAVNAAIRDVPDDMTVAIHTCRGNFKSTWLASGSYDYVAETAFSKPRRRRLLPRVRRRALGRLRAAALHPEGQEGGARPGVLQDARSWKPRTR